MIRYYLIFRKRGIGRWIYVGDVISTTSYGAIREFIRQSTEDGELLSTCDLAAVADWAFHKEHYDNTNR